MRALLSPLLLSLLLAACEEGQPGLDLCRDTVCPLGQACDPGTGMCAAGEGPCATITCATGHTCDPRDGLCKPDPGTSERCADIVCPDGQSCDPSEAACRNNPPPPSLPQAAIDRVGRPLVSTLLVNPFGLFKIMGVPEEMSRSKEKYNSEGAPARWVASFAPYLRESLALLDALDGTCGNQWLAGAAGAARYNGLANLLAADVLQLNTAAPGCSAFLAVEAGAAECGGRRPSYDVVDRMYTLFITGTVIEPVRDGVASSVEPSDSFPFLAPAQ